MASNVVDNPKIATKEATKKCLLLTYFNRHPPSLPLAVVYEKLQTIDLFEAALVGDTVNKHERFRPSDVCFKLQCLFVVVLEEREFCWLFTHLQKGVKSWQHFMTFFIANYFFVRSLLFIARFISIFTCAATHNQSLRFPEKSKINLTSCPNESNNSKLTNSPSILHV